MKPCLPAALFLAFLSFGAAVRADTFYVSYYNKNAIEEYAPDGTDLGPFPATNLNGPAGMAFDSGGNLYVANSLGNTIEEFSPTGVDLGTFAKTGLNVPIALVFDSAGNLYVSNNAGNTIEKFAPDGTDLGVFARPGSLPWGLAFDSGGNLCVSNENSQNVVRISSSGASLGNFTSTNLSHPTGIAFDLNGNLDVANQGNDTVQIFSPAGTNLGHVAVNGLNEPSGLLFDSGGNLYICDTLNSDIRKVSTNGTVTAFANTTASGPMFIVEHTQTGAPVITGEPGNLTLTAGNLATFGVAASGSGLAYQWQFNGAPLTDGGPISGSKTSILRVASVNGGDAGQYRAVVSNSAGVVASDPATLTVIAAVPAPPGTYYVSYLALNSIEEFSANGTDLGTFPAAGLQGPEGIAFDAQGNLYVANSLTNIVEEFAPDGTDLGPFATTGLDEPIGLVFDHAGNLYAANNASDAIEKFAPDGTDLGIFAPTGSHPWGLAFDSGGNLYVSAQNDNSVQEFSPTGGNLGFFLSNNLDHPNGLAFDLGGNLYVANQGSNLVEVYSPSAAFLGDAAAANLDEPTGLFFDSGGNLFICDSLNNQIRKVSPAGVDLGVFANTPGANPIFMIVQLANDTVAITSPPANLIVTAGGNASFSATASGNPGPAYQWQLSSNGGATWANLTDGINISGANTSTLLIGNTLAAMSGYQFRVVAFNDFSSIASTAANLTVDTIPIFTTQPANRTVIAGNTAAFSVAASGSPPPSFQWQISTNSEATWANLTDGVGISGSTTPSLTISNTTSAMSGNQFRALAINRAGTTLSNPATLNVQFPPTIITPPASVIVLPGNATTFTVTTSGNPLPGYHWYFGKKAVAGATSANLTIAKAGVTNAGNYTVVVSNGIGANVTSQIATLTLGVPVKITTSPTSQTVAVTQNAVFKSAATGTPPPAYQWQLSINGTVWSNITDGNFSGFTSANLTVLDANATQSGNQFRAVATNFIGNTTYAATSKPAILTVTSPPDIIGLTCGNQSSVDGGNQTIIAGSNLTFSVNATGSTLKYQWQLNGKNIPGATKSTYTLTKATSASAGRYTVVVSNSLKSFSSSAFVVTVLYPPLITTQPRSQIVKAGNQVTFTVVINPLSAMPVARQWFFGGKSLSDNSTISGSNTTMLNLSEVTSGEAGTYYIRLSNIAGNLTSGAATLKVN